MKKTISFLILFLGLNLGVSYGMPRPDISPWAIDELIDAEVYGLVDRAWYYDGFNKEFKDKDYRSLLEKFQKELDQLGLEKKENFQSLDLTGEFNRGYFLKSLYNIYGPYCQEDFLDSLRTLNILAGDLNEKGSLSLEEGVLFTKRALEGMKLREKKQEEIIILGEKDKRKIYLVTSPSYVSKEVYPLGKSLEEALLSSTMLILDQDPFSGLGDYDYRSFDLENYLGQDKFKDLESFMGRFNIEKDSYKDLKPWAVLSSLTSINMGLEGYYRDYDLSSYLALKAKNRGYDLAYLQGQEDGLGLMEGLEKDFIIEGLNMALDGDLGIALDITKAWEKSDLEELRKIDIKGPYKSFNIIRNNLLVRKANQVDEKFNSHDGDVILLVRPDELLSDINIISLLELKNFNFK